MKSLLTQVAIDELKKLGYMLEPEQSKLEMVFNRPLNNEHKDKTLRLTFYKTPNDTHALYECETKASGPFSVSDESGFEDVLKKHPLAIKEFINALGL
jgi:hypothetical protein